VAATKETVQAREIVTEIDNYRLIEPLTPGRSFLCADASGNIVVLVKLEDDCLHGPKLHPSIRDRLARVRELPHPRIATLRSVERWSGLACMVWIYLDGENWDELVRNHPGQFCQLASALVSNVATLHDIGIVHGNIHGRNIIVRPDRQVWLTQVSPYLYTDPAVDIAAVMDVLRAAGERLPSSLRDRLFALLDGFHPQNDSLKELAHALASIDLADSVERVEMPVAKPPSYRRRSLIGAGMLTAAAVGLGVFVNWRLTHPSKPGPATIGVVKPGLHG
jgi:tRNA A-37 threonylcarbamoyl transferase component Bud32